MLGDSYSGTHILTVAEYCAASAQTTPQLQHAAARLQSSGVPFPRDPKFLNNNFLSFPHSYPSCPTRTPRRLERLAALNWNYWASRLQEIVFQFVGHTRETLPWVPAARGGGPNKYSTTITVSPFCPVSTVVHLRFPLHYCTILSTRVTTPSVPRPWQ
jgi:hypothetical protein